MVKWSRFYDENPESTASISNSVNFLVESWSEISTKSIRSAWDFDQEFSKLEYQNIEDSSDWINPSTEPPS